MSITPNRRLRAMAASLATLATLSALAACNGDNTGGSDATATTIAPSASAIPSTPVGDQLRWALDHLAPGARAPSLEDVKDHVSAEFLRYMVPAEALVDVFQDTVDDRGGVRFERFAFEPRADAAVALVRTGRGEKAALFVEVAPRAPHRIEAIALDERPAEPLSTSGPHSGLFDIDGRQIFLSCTGEGGPTVVLVGGLSSDWTKVQEPASATTRVCSYDKPNVVGSRSEPAPTPRDATGMAAELAALLDAAAVPAPYVVVGHSNGGMVAQLFAGAHPDQIAGIVLVDSAHEDQDRRAAELIRRELPPNQAEALIAGMTTMPPRVLDPEQFDHPKSRAQLRASRMTSPLPAVPMAVLVHGRPLDNIPPELAELYEPIWQQMQRDVAALVPGATYQIVAGSGHDIHQERPDVVAGTILDVVAAAREGQT